jgi:hypothetical protein
VQPPWVVVVVVEPREVRGDSAGRAGDGTLGRLVGRSPTPGHQQSAAMQPAGPRRRRLSWLALPFGGTADQVLGISLRIARIATLSPCRA